MLCLLNRVLTVLNVVLKVNTSQVKQAAIFKSLAVSPPMLSQAPSSAAWQDAISETTTVTQLLILRTPLVLSGCQTLLSSHTPPLEAVRLRSRRLCYLVKLFVFINENDYKRSSS